MKLLTARFLLSPDGEVLEGGGVLVVGGRIAAVPRTSGAARRAARVHGATVEDLGQGILTPGLVNAHAHLELSGFHRRVPATRTIRPWIESLIAMRRAVGDHTLGAGVRRGADRLLRTGTTAVGDIDSTGAAGRVLAGHRLRVRLYREVLDGGDPVRAEAACAAVRRALPRRAGLCEGLSPHSPYSVSPALFALIGKVARRRCLPVTIHWSETPAELEWMRAGQGELAGLVRNSPHRTGLDLIEEAGLLGPRTALVHGNHPERGEALRIQRADATLVHCPGSHLFFGRDPFPIRHYRERGVRIALGTDSSASNDDLDMRREMALLRRSAPGLDPREVFAMATDHGARALGLEGEVGRLERGARADLCHFRLSSEDTKACLDELTTAIPEVGGVWIAGRRVAQHA